MKIDELMIDDWVVGRSGEPFQIKIIDPDFLYWDEIQPIPLTHEILVKLGFETQPNIGYIIDDWDGNQIIYDSWNHNLRIIKNYKTCLDIETFNDLAVHELQHALKLCGIEKKIIL